MKTHYQHSMPLFAIYCLLSQHNQTQSLLLISAPESLRQVSLRHLTHDSIKNLENRKPAARQSLQIASASVRYIGEIILRPCYRRIGTPPSLNRIRMEIGDQQVATGL